MFATDGVSVLVPKAASAKWEEAAPIATPLSRRILAQSCFFLLIFVYLFFAAETHDPLWWEHAGIKDNHTGRQLHPTLARKLEEGKTEAPHLHAEFLMRSHSDEVRFRYSRPVNGSAFIADYDVSKVVPLREPPLRKSGPGRYLFHYINKSTTKHRMEWLSQEPMVAWLPGFLSDAECDAIIAEASKTMRRSEVSPYKDAANKDSVSEIRTSSQTWLDTGSLPAKPVVDRILDLTGFPAGSAEMLQVLRYEVGQKYDAHLDYFDPTLYGAQTTNRAVTVFLYLTTVLEGGYTQFPRASGKPHTEDYTSCKAGLKVRPVKGTVALFYDMRPNGDYDDYSLHGGCKPEVGTKFGGTLWLRVPVV